MAQAQRNSQGDTLGLDSDGDDVELICAIEGSFGVNFGDKTRKWFTVGDIYDALLAEMPSPSSQRLCATSMAFYQLRRIIEPIARTDDRVRPTTKLAGLTTLGPKKLFLRLSQELGVRQQHPAWSWRGWLGLLSVVAGVGVLATVQSLLPSASTIVFGLIAMRTDPGSYGSMLVGDLARTVALRNAAHFLALGGDARPATLWRTLCELLEEECGVQPFQITRDTLLLAQRDKRTL